LRYGDKKQKMRMRVKGFIPGCGRAYITNLYTQTTLMTGMLIFGEISVGVRSSTSGESIRYDQFTRTTAKK
jgi:hypothetical protein